jgi:phytoene desaturase
VASNADVVHPYGRPLRDETAAQTMRKRLSRSAYSMSLVLIYFGTRRRYPNLLHHNIIFGPRYRELLREIFSGGRLADDFSLYLHAPTRSDADLAPPGCDAFYVLSPVPHLGKAAIDWRSQGPIYAEKKFSYLERRYMPDLRREIVTQRIFTPADFKKRAQLSSGLRLFVEPRLTQSAYFRVHIAIRTFAVSISSAPGPTRAPVFPEWSIRRRRPLPSFSMITNLRWHSGPAAVERFSYA